MDGNTKAQMSLGGIMLTGPWCTFPPDSGACVKRRREGLRRIHSRRVFFMAFWTEIWKLHVPLWHFLLKHVIPPNKNDLEAKFWDWEVSCPLWVGRNFSDGGKCGNSSGTGSLILWEHPLLIPLWIFFSQPSQAAQTQGLPRGNFPSGGYLWESA